jgi:WD40 repeat protein
VCVYIYIYMMLSRTAPISGTPEDRLFRIQNVKAETDALRHHIIYIKRKVMDATLSQVAANTPALARFKYKCRNTLKGHSEKIYQMKISRDGRFLATIGQDDFALVWNARSTYKLDAITLENSFVLSIGLSPSGAILAGGGLENSVDLYEVNHSIDETVLENGPTRPGRKRGSGPLRQRVPIASLRGHRGFISQLDFLSDETVITASGDMSIGVWDIESNARLAVYGYGDHLGSINQVLPHPSDAHIFASTSSDRMVKIWDTRERRSQQTFAGHEGDITSARFFPDGNAVATSAEDGTIRLFDLRSDCQLAVINVDRDSIPVSAICFTPSGRTLLVGYEDGSCGSLDVLRGSWVSQLNGHRDVISSICVAEEGRLYTSSWDGTVRAWEPQW